MIADRIAEKLEGLLERSGVLPPLQPIQIHLRPHLSSNDLLFLSQAKRTIDGNPGPVVEASIHHPRSKLRRAEMQTHLDETF